MVRSMVIITTMTNPLNATVNAFNIVSMTMRRLNNTTSSFPLICALAVANNDCEGR